MRSEGLGGLDYFHDYYCSKCGGINCFKVKKKSPKIETQFSVIQGIGIDWSNCKEMINDKN